MDDDKKKILYDGIKDTYDNIGTYEQFVEKLNDPTKRRRLYDAVSQDFDNFKSYDEFNEKLGFGVTPANGNAQPVKAENTEEPVPSKGAENQPANQPAQAQAVEQTPSTPVTRTKVGETLPQTSSNISVLPRASHNADNYWMRQAVAVMENAEQQHLQESAKQLAKQQTLTQQITANPNDEYQKSILSDKNNTVYVNNIAKDDDANMIFESALATSRDLGVNVVFGQPDVQKNYDLWRLNRGGGDKAPIPTQVTSTSKEALLNAAYRLQAEGAERPAWMSQKAWDEASRLTDKDVQNLAATLQKKSRKYMFNTKVGDEVYYSGVSSESVTGFKAPLQQVEDLYSIPFDVYTRYYLCPDGRVRPIQYQDPQTLVGGEAAAKEIRRRIYNEYITGIKLSDKVTMPVVGNFVADGDTSNSYFVGAIDRITNERIEDNPSYYEYKTDKKGNPLKDKDGNYLIDEKRGEILRTKSFNMGIEWIPVKKGQTVKQALSERRERFKQDVIKALPTKIERLVILSKQAKEILKEAEKLHQKYEDKAKELIYDEKRTYLDKDVREEVNNIKAIEDAIDQIEKAIENYQDVYNKLKRGENVGNLEALWRGLSDLDNWTMGLWNLRKKLATNRALNGNNEEIKNLLKTSYSLSQDAQSQFAKYVANDNYNIWYSAGYSIPFTVQAIATYGVGSSIARGIIGQASKFAARYVERQILNFAIKGVSRLFTTNVAAGIDTLFQSGRVTQDALQKYWGAFNYKYDEKGRIKYTGNSGGMSMGKAFVTSFLSNAKENVSERFGSFILDPITSKIHLNFGADMKGAGMVLTHNNVGQFMSRYLPYEKLSRVIQSNAYQSIAGQTIKVLKRGGYDGVVNEYLEEVAGNIMSVPLGEMTWDDVIDKKQNTETFLSVALSSGFMLGFQSGAGSYGYFKNRRKIDRAFQMADADGIRLFGYGAWNNITDGLVNCNDDVMVENLKRGVNDNTSLSKEQKTAITRYIGAQRMQAAFNNIVSNENASAKDGSTLNDQNVSAALAYTEGRNMQNEEEYRRAEQEYNDTKEMATNALGIQEDIDTYLDGLGNTVAEQMQNAMEEAKEKGVDEKDATVALAAYLNARETRRGSHDAQEVDRDIRRWYVDKDIEQKRYEGDGSSSNVENKSVVATLEDGSTVYIIRGTIENNAVAGDNVIVRDETGETRMIPSSEVAGIVGEQNLDDLKQKAYDELEQEDRKTQSEINREVDLPLAGQGGFLIDGEGHRMEYHVLSVMNDEKGNPASVIVRSSENKDYMIPIGTFNTQRMMGRKYEAIKDYLDENDEEYHATEGAMNERYLLASEEEEAKPNDNAKPSDNGGTADNAKPKPRVGYDYSVKVEDEDGNVVDGRVSSTENGLMEVTFDKPFNGQTVARFTEEELDNVLQESHDADGNLVWSRDGESVLDDEAAPQDNAETPQGETAPQESNETETPQEEIPSGESVGTQDITQENVPQQGETQESTTQGEEELSHRTALERIPRDENGEPVFEQAETPEDAWDALVEFSGGNAATAKEIADAMVEEKRKAYEKAQKLKLKGKTPTEMLASKQANAAELAKAESEYNHWLRMANVEKSRQNAIRNQKDQEEELQGNEPPASGEQNQTGTEPSERGGGTENAGSAGGGKGNLPPTEGRKESEENEENELDENGRPFIKAENGTTVFGEITDDSGLTAAPIKLSEGFQDANTGKGYGLVHIEANHGEQIRQAGFTSVKEFVSFVATHYDPDNIRVGKRRDDGSGTFLIQVTDTHDNTLFIELSKDGSYWNVNSGGIFRKGYSNKKETVAKTEPQQPTNAVSSNSSLSANVKDGITNAEPNGEPTVSLDKGTTLPSAPQTSEEENSEKVVDSDGENTLQGKIDAASADVNTEPTEAQKEAGNYKKGHVQVGTFDITIEQPEGSIRRGTDANGKQWESKMHNTYGYFRGTEGVDGDHIDVFLSNDIDGWNGRKVFVVDQYNPDGTFDEHKVMLGFNDMDEAKSDYLANYEKGWGNGRRIDVSATNLEDFEKWIDSSHRKTKPFSEYSSVNKETMGNAPAKKPTLRKKESSTKKKTTEEKPQEQHKAETKDKKKNPGRLGLVSDERMEELKKRLRDKLNNLNAGIDPEIVAIGAELAAGYIDRGVVRIEEFAKALVKDLGDVARPYIKILYNSGREWIEAEDAEFASEMTPYEEVKKFDAANFDKAEDEHKGVFDAAEMKAKEQKIEEGAKKIKDKDEKTESESETEQTITETNAEKETEKAEENNKSVSSQQKQPYTVTPTTYTNKSGKTTDVFRLEFSDMKNVGQEELKAVDKLANDIYNLKVGRFKYRVNRGWRDRDSDGWIFRNEEDARRAAEIVFGKQTEKTNEETKEETPQENQNTNDNEEVQLRTRTSEGERGEGTEHRPSEQMGTQTGDSSERTDGRRVGGRGVTRTGDDTNRSTGVSRQTEGKPNVDTQDNPRNFHGERGEIYAPSSVNARINANLEAIELAHRLVENGEIPTREQMKILARFSGWGGLGALFDERDWRNRENNKKLRGLIGEEAYKDAALSAHTSYYTPTYVIDTMWDIAKALGFKGGNVLEGSAGIGNILGQMPLDVSGKSKIQAVEFDKATGNILSLLYPDANVGIQGFENTNIKNGSVDLAITNVPFSTGMRVNDDTGDKDLSKKFHNIHDFCIAKNVRKLREGGIGIFISSSGTLDNSKALRDWVVNEGNADFIGAFRMNNETFTGTPVTSDIIIIRKRVNGEKSSNAIDVSQVGVARTADVIVDKKSKSMPLVYNQYFIDHPEYMAGEMYYGGEMGDSYRPTSTGLYADDNTDQKKSLQSFVDSFKNMKEEKRNEVSVEEQAAKEYEKLGENVKEGSIIVDKNGNVCVAQNGEAVPMKSSPKKGENVSDKELSERFNSKKVKGHTKAECVQSYVAIKNALNEVLDYQNKHDDDKGLKPLLDKLNKAYDGFVSTYGHFNNNRSIPFLRNDVDYASVLALENYSVKGDKQGNRLETFGKSDVFKGRVVRKYSIPTPKNVTDGVVISLQMTGGIDLSFISSTLGESADEVREEILDKELAYEDPVTHELVVSYQYLSGNVLDKLMQAQSQNEDGRYDANVEALRKAMPVYIPAHMIDFSLGSSWIKPSLFNEFIKEKTGIEVKCNYSGGIWTMEKPHYDSSEQNKAYGVKSEKLDKTFLGTDLILAAMQNKSLNASQTKGGKMTTDKDATRNIAMKIEEIRQDFRDWLHGKIQNDEELSAEIEKTYNEQFNNYVPLSIPREFAPSRYPGMVTSLGGGQEFALRPHQSEAVVKGVTQPTLLAHEVGTGKTFTLITTAMEMRRLGTAKKPMIVVQNATIGQFSADAKRLYPNAKILTISDVDSTATGRKNFYNKIRYNDWDMVIVTQSAFDMIPDSKERQLAFIQERIEEKLALLERLRWSGDKETKRVANKTANEIAKLYDDINDLSEETEEGLSMMEDAGMTSMEVKQREKNRQNAEVKAKEMLDRKTDDVSDFDEMGIDALLVDEAHAYKHLGFSTMMQRGVKGVDSSSSKGSQGLYLKVQAIKEKCNGRNVVFATGTPISNTTGELWTFLHYLLPEDKQKAYGIYYFDDFVRNFGSLEQKSEFTTSGAFKEVNRFSNFVNMPELMRIWSEVADTVLTENNEELQKKIPEMEGGKAQDIYLPQTKALRSVMKYVRAQLKAFDKMSGKQKKENSHIPLVMYGIATAAAVDPRLVLDDAVDETNSKTNETVRQTLRSLEETKDYKGTVAIFADHYQNKQSGFNLYEDIRKKLIEKGVPEDQIVIMTSGMTVKKKNEIFDKVNSGEVRVIMGSTQTLGTGVNIQERLHTLVHVDAPVRPMDYTQRNGRILRQGNLHKEWGKKVRVLRMGVEDSLDVTAYQRLKTKGAFVDAVMHGMELLKDPTRNRVLEEEDDLFGDTVANLSGSEYAMLKNQAERDLRKYLSRKNQWEADQKYISVKKSQLKSSIERCKNSISFFKERMKTLEEHFPNGQFKTIKVGKNGFASVAEMAEYIKDFNKKINEDKESVRSSATNETRHRKVEIDIDGVIFTVKAVTTKGTSRNGSSLFSKAQTTMTYDCEELGIKDAPVYQMLLRNALEDITEEVIPQKESRDALQLYEDNLKNYTQDLSVLTEREGRPFEYEKELQKAEQHVAEYTEKMKAELAAKEAKYAEMDKDIDEVDGNDIFIDEDDDDDLFRTRLQKASEDGTVSEREAALRDMVIDRLRESGMDVVTDEKEGQRVLDEANGEARMSAKKKRALETASVSHEEKHQPTVVSSALGANVLKKLDTTIDNFENQSNRSKTFIGDVAQALGAERHGSASEYATFETKNGKVVTIRLANHNAKVSNFDNRDEQEGISIVVSAKENAGMTNDGNAHVVEYFYDAIDLRRAEGKPLADIVRSIKQALYSGEFKDTTGLAERQEVNANDGVRYFRTSNGQAYGYTVGGKIYIDPRIANAETPIHEYAHLWATALRKGNPEQWSNVVGLMKGTDVWEEVKKTYPELKTDDEIADEVLAQYSGRRGAERLRKMQQEIAEGEGSVFEKAEKTGLLGRVREAIAKVWEWVGDFLHIKYESAEQVADQVMRDLWKGVDPRRIGVDEKVREQFIGEKGAERADHAEEANTRMENLGVAREMEKAGKDAKAVKMATGWERGADGKWRYEIPDGKYFKNGDAGFEKARARQSWSGELDKLEDRIFDGDELSEEENRRFEELAGKEAEFKAEFLKREKPHLADWLKNDELFKAYPELKGMGIVYAENTQGDVAGYYSRRDNQIVVNVNSSLDTESIIAHEVQHAIQDIEGFAKGGNTESIEREFQKAKAEWAARAYAHELEETAKELGEDYDQAAVEKALIKEYKDMDMSDWLPDKETRIKGFNYFARGYADRSLDDAIKQFRLKESPRADFNSYLEYRKLGGEVEARNVQSRMGMTPEERRASLAAETEDVAREDQIFLRGGSSDYSASEHFVSPTEMSGDEKSKRGDKLMNAPAVEAKRNQIVRTDGMSARQAAEKWWKENIGKPLLYNTEVGQVEINEKSIGSSLAHRYGQPKLDAITSLKDGFGNAVYLGTMSDFTRQEGVLNHYFAYPINYNGKRSYVFCRAMQDTNKNRLYVHEVFMADNIQNESNTLQTAAFQPHGGIALYKSILSDVLSAANVAKGNGTSKGAALENDDLFRRNEDNTHDATSNNEAKGKAVDKVSQKLHLGNVVVHETAGGLGGYRATAKGWFDPRTGQIHIVLSNNADVSDVTKTILHEAVAHYGLRAMFGNERFSQFINSRIEKAPEEVRKKIYALMAKHGYDQSVAAEEYLASLAEETAMSGAVKKFLANVRYMIYKLLEAIGIRDKERPTLNDNELKYILWQSYRSRSKGEKNNFVFAGEKAAMAGRLGVGAFETESDEGLLFRQDFEQQQKLQVRDEYERMINLESHKLMTAWVDSMQSLKDFQNAIEKAIGKKISDNDNAYYSAIALSSKNYAMMDLYKNTFYQHLLDCIGDFKETGFGYEDVTDYVMFKHGLERNEYMRNAEADKLFAEYQEKHPRGGKTRDDFYNALADKDYAGLRGKMARLNGTDIEDIDTATAEYCATQNVKNFEQVAGSLCDNLWDAINACTKESLRTGYEAGLLSKETYDKINSMYQYYVPLRGFEETTSDEVYNYFGGDGKSMSAVYKKAKGRSSEADDPFANIGNMAELAIMQANRNRYKQKFLNLALNHPSDLVSIHEMYIHLDPSTGKWEAVTYPSTEGMDEQQAKDTIDKFVEDMEDKVENNPDEYKRASERPDIPYRVIVGKNEHQIHIKRNGKDYVLTINGNPMLAQAVNGLFNPDTDINPFMAAIKRGTHGLAALATQKNISFSISNFIRDLTYASNISVKENAAYAKQYRKNLGITMKNIFGLIGRQKSGKLDMNNPLDRIFHEFILNGGETGYTFMHSVEEYKGEIAKALNMSNGKTKHYVVNDIWRAYVKAADYVNRASEDIVRFTAYMTSRQDGRSIERAVQDAKEVSVNFNRKGAGSKSAGRPLQNGNTFNFFSSYTADFFKNFYMFMNAGIQGLGNFAKLAYHNPKAFTAWVSVPFALGALAPILGTAMCGAFGGDPDDYYNIPEYKRRQNICIYVGNGNWLTIPLAIELRSFYGMGELISSQLTGGTNYEGYELAKKIAGQFSQILPLDAMEEGAMTFVPSFFRPVAEVAVNKDWTGMPVYKESFNKYTPAWQNHYNSTNGTFVNASKWLNEIGGGDDVSRGTEILQINPGIVEHLVEGYTSGTGVLFNRTYKTVRDAVSREELQLRNVPFANILLTHTDDRTQDMGINERFYNEKQKGDKLIHDYNGYVKQLQNTGDKKYQQKVEEIDNSPKIASYALWKNYSRIVKPYNEELKTETDAIKIAAIKRTMAKLKRATLEASQKIRDCDNINEADNILNHAYDNIDW